MVFEFKTKIYYIYKNSCYLRFFIIEFKYCFKAESCKRGYQINGPQIGEPPPDQTLLRVNVGDVYGPGERLRAEGRRRHRRERALADAALLVAK